MQWLFETIATAALGCGTLVAISLLLCGVIALRVLDPVFIVNATVTCFVFMGFWGVGQMVRKWLAWRKAKPEPISPTE